MSILYLIYRGLNCDHDLYRRMFIVMMTIIFVFVLSGQWVVELTTAPDWLTTVLRRASVTASSLSTPATR